MTTFLSSIDCFGLSPYLYINKYPKYQTNLTGTTSIILILAGVAVFLVYGQELFFRTNSSVNFSTQSLDFPDKLLYFHNNEVMISIQDNNKKPKNNESIYYPKAVLFKTTKDPQGNISSTKTEISINKCSEVFSFDSANHNLFMHRTFIVLIRIVLI